VALSLPLLDQNLHEFSGFEPFLASTRLCVVLKHLRALVKDKHISFHETGPISRDFANDQAGAIAIAR
jgi:hypothetical protein